MIVDNMKAEKIFIEDNLNNIGNDTDPYEMSKPELSIGLSTIELKYSHFVK